MSERVRSLLGAVRGALLPAMVVLCVAFILVMLARARRTIGELAAAALEATRARLRRAAPSPGVLAGLAGWSRIADGRARPAFTAEGSPRLSLALEPVSAVGAPPAGAPRGRGIRRPSGNDGRAEDAPRAAPIVGPVELERPAPPSTMDDVAQPAEPDRAAHAPRLRPVYRPVARAVAPVPPQRWRAQMRRPLPADTSAPTTPESVPPPVGVAADEAGEPLALEPELAVAAEREEETAGALRLDDQTVACTISVWHGYVKSRFYARVSTPDGETHTLAESPPFRRRGEVPEALPDAVSAHEALLEHLRAEGWRPVGSLGAWYAICLQPTAPALMSIPR